MPCTVVVGAQWGDEGKGKIVDRLSGEAEIVARYQGGPNAGHSIRRGDDTLVLHLVPSGVLHPVPRCLIGNGVVIDLLALRGEVVALEAQGVTVNGRLGVSPAAHVILPYHRAVEAVSERSAGAIGTTGRGIGYAYRDKVARTGVRIGDLFEPDTFARRVDANLEGLRREFPDAALGDLTPRRLLDELGEAIRWLEPLVTDVSREIDDALRAGRRVLLEGAQGTLLDIDHGTYPFVTSSSAGAAGAPLGVGIGPRRIDHVIGVTKAYATRVGHGPFPTELPPQAAERLREIGEEYGATTGRPRRCGWLDLPALRYAARVNGLDALIVTKLDVLDGFDEIPTAVGYELDGAPCDGFPAGVSQLERVVPVWQRHPGWRTPTSGIRAWRDLPAAALRYLDSIEAAVGVPITSVSVGARRDEEIPRS